MAYNFDYLSGYSPGGSLVDYSSGLSTKVSGFNGVSSKSSNSSNMWGAIASAAGGVVSSLINGNSAKKQFKYQQKLNEQQQEYARENATTAYNRQRELTADNPLLQKIGMRNAGMSTAFSDGSSVGAASSVDQAAAPNAGSAPEIPQVGSLFGQGVQAVASVADLAMKRAQIAKMNSDVANTNADTTGKEIENLTKGAQNVANLENTKADTKGKAAKSHIDETQGKILDATGMQTAVANQNLAESNASIAASDASVRDLQNYFSLNQQIADLDLTLARKDLTNEERKNAEETRKNIIKQRDVMTSQINANNASAYASYASGADSYSHVGVNNAVAEGQDLQNKFDRDTFEDRKKTIHNQRVRSWLDAQPRSLQEALMADADVRRTFNKMRVGKPLDAADWSRIVSIAGYEKAGDIVKATGSFIGGLGKKNVKRTIVEHRSLKK